MTTATLSATQRRQRGGARAARAAANTHGVNGGSGGQPSAKGKQQAAAIPSTAASAAIPGLSSAPDWPAGGSNPVVQRLSSASEFWELCVVARQPGLLPASALDGDDDDKVGNNTLFTAPYKWTPSYLKAKAGHVLFGVETRKDSSDRFGKGATKTEMSFSEFLDKAATFSSASSSSSSKEGTADEGSLLYLSAQKPPKPVGKGKGAPPPPLGPLALALADDFPVVPKLARGLVLQSVNLWCGRSFSSSNCSSTASASASASSTSSGLHHDFHDNLYAVVGGTKKFTLFPPRSVAEMAPVGGKPRFIHSNGRIVYRCQGEVGADGGDERLVRRHEYRRWREVILADGVEVESDDEEEGDDGDNDESDDGCGGGTGANKRLADNDGNGDDDDDEDDADLVAALAAAERAPPSPTTTAKRKRKAQRAMTTTTSTRRRSRRSTLESQRTRPCCRCTGRCRSRWSPGTSFTCPAAGFTK